MLCALVGVLGACMLIMCGFHFFVGVEMKRVANELVDWVWVVVVWCEVDDPYLFVYVLLCYVQSVCVVGDRDVVMDALREVVRLVILLGVVLLFGEGCVFARCVRIQLDDEGLEVDMDGFGFIECEWEVFVLLFEGCSNF